MLTKIIIIFFNCFLILFLTGCIKKQNINSEAIMHSEVNKNYFSACLTEQCSLKEAKLIGLILLPNALEERIIKDKNFYIVDSIFDATFNNEKNLFSLLKKLYIADGWTLEEESTILEYMITVFKKANKEIYLFIENREKYDKKNHLFKKNIFLHQSLLLFN